MSGFALSHAISQMSTALQKLKNIRCENIAALVVNIEKEAL